MKNIIIIIGHSHYATGLLSALEMIGGPKEDVIAIDFDGNEDVVPKYESAIKKYSEDNVLFVCDMLGGTPYKEASKLAYPKSNIEVVVGCNLGSLIEISLAKDNLNLEELKN